MTGPSPCPDAMTLSVPFQIVKRGGREEMHLPEGAIPLQRPDDTLIKALARAFRWSAMLESGQFTTISELAAHERITLS